MYIVSHKIITNISWHNRCVIDKHNFVNFIDTETALQKTILKKPLDLSTPECALFRPHINSDCQKIMSSSPEESINTKARRAHSRGEHGVSDPTATSQVYGDLM